MNTAGSFNKLDSGFLYGYVLPGSLLLWVVLVMAVGVWWGGGTGGSAPETVTTSNHALAAN